MANASSLTPAAGTTPCKKKVSVVFVNLFAPQRYLTFGLPLSLEVLTGDLRGQFPGQVEVTILDMQTGLSAEDVVRRIQQLNPNVLGITVKVTERKLAEKILDPVLAPDFPRRIAPATSSSAGIGRVFSTTSSSRSTTTSSFAPAKAN